MGLQINILKDETEKMLIFKLVGSLDTETYENFMEKVALQLSKPLKAVVLDLKGLEYISSMGISAILQARGKIESIGCSLMLSNVPEHIEQVFQIVKALPDVPMFESIAEADNYFMEIQKQIKEKK